MLNRVPYEIFGQIIKSSYTHRLSIPFSSGSAEISLPPTKATHVCRAWRTALLSDSMMWTCIMLTDETMMHVNQMMENLARSGSAPLDVFIEYYSVEALAPSLLRNLLKTISIVSQELHRCRQLQITIATQTVPVFFRCLHQPFPLLQTFSLEVVDDEGDLKPGDMLKVIDAVLFLGDAPNLKHVYLEISARLNDLQLSVFKNLSVLHLRFAVPVVDGDILLDLLQSSPCLRILNISWVIFGQKTVLSMPSDRRIPMPYLQRLLLRHGCRADLINLILGYLDFPVENVKFEIECDNFQSAISVSTPLLHFLNRRRLTYLAVNGFNRLTLDFVEKMDQGLSLHPDENSRFQTEYDTHHASSHYLPNFLRMFNLANITHMYLGCTSLKPALLRSIFGSLENLQCLRVYHRSPFFPGSPVQMRRLYLKALTPRLKLSSPQTHASSQSEMDKDTDPDSDDIVAGQGCFFPCPSLRTLEVLFCYEDLSMRLDEAYLRAVVRCLRIRERAGYPFKYIANCYRSSSLAGDFEALQAHEGLPIEVRRSKYVK